MSIELPAGKQKNPLQKFENPEYKKFKNLGTF